MSIPFRVKFTIFDESKNMTVKQKNIRKKLICEDLEDILYCVFRQDDKYKVLDRAEPSISSIDENKQLRMDISAWNNWYKPYCVPFMQEYTEENFTIDELTYISNKIRDGLEEYLHYEIDSPIIYIEIDQ